MKFQIAYKLFHNSTKDKTTELGFVDFNPKTNRFRFDLKNLDQVSDHRVQDNIREMIREFCNEPEHEQNEYPIRYNEDFCIEIQLKQNFTSEGFAIYKEEKKQYEK